MNTFIGPGPRVVADYTEALAVGSHSNRFSRILNSLQIFMIYRRIVITLEPLGDPSKQCRKDLVVSPRLKLGLRPFLIFPRVVDFHGCNFACASLPIFASFVRVQARNFRENRAVLSQVGRLAPDLHDGFLSSNYVRQKRTRARGQQDWALVLERKHRSEFSSCS
jgi:hypothetical protein